MTLIEDWKLVLSKAWSVKFQVLAAFFTTLEATVPYVKPDGTNSNVFALLAGSATLLALIARVLAQKELQQ